MKYHLSEGIWVMVVSFLLIMVLILYTRHVKWILTDKLLLLLMVVNYILDTIWWVFSLHFPFTDLLFHFNHHTEQLTLFFLLAGLAFIFLFIRRLFIK